MLNVSYLNTARSYVKIFQMFVSSLSLLFICGKWSSGSTCFNNVLLEMATIFTLIALSINAILFSANLVQHVPRRIEGVATWLCVMLMFAQIFVITKSITSKPISINKSHLVVAILFTTISISLFSYLSVFACLLHRLHVRIRLAKKLSSSGKAAAAVDVSLLPVSNEGCATGDVATDHQSRERVTTVASVSSIKIKPIKLYKATNFQFKGPLKIPKKNKFEMAPLLDKSTVDNVQKDGHLTFTESNNVVYDIGSEVEQLID